VRSAIRASVILALIAMSVTFVPMASAVAAAPSPTPSECATYPIGAVPAAELAVSTTTPFPGESIMVSGSNFVANEAITIELHSAPIVLAHVTTDGNGAFSVHVTIPSNLTGTHTIDVAGDHSFCPSSPVTITIQSSGTSPSGGGLPNTGVDILAGVAIALALLAAGIALTHGGRRKQHGPARHTAR